MRAFFALVFTFTISLAISLAPNSAAALVDTSTTAAVVVDMQQGFYDRGGVSETVGLQNLVNRQIDLLKWAVAEKVPVLLFEYEGFGVTDPRLTAILKGHPYKRITKQSDDGFTTPSVKPALKFLKKHGIKNLIMSGINGNACVYSTTTGAISFGYYVATSSDIVGNLNQNPPIYPNNTWYFKDNKFSIFANLDEILY